VGKEGRREKRRKEEKKLVVGHIGYSQVFSNYRKAVSTGTQLPWERVSP
jgi:hypothetical protein